ncbi:hypothetical protein [Clostridium saccharoperbutylacetonicum]
MAKINFEDAVIKIIKRYLVSFGKSLASKFYTKKQVDTMILPIPAIQTDIASLKTRSVIGSKLKTGLYKPATKITGGVTTGIVKMGTKISGDFTLNADGTITLPKGSYYKVRGALRFTTNTTSGFASYMIRNFTDSMNAGVAATINSYSYWEGQQEAIAYIDTIQKDINVGIYITGVNNATGAEITDGFTFLDIQEVNRTTIIDPCEDGKNINFEYGMFKLSTSPTTMAVGDFIKFNTMPYGNMSINPATYQVPLKANKKYRISIDISGVFHNTVFALYNITTGTVIQILYGAVNDIDYNYLSTAEFIYEPTADCNVGVKCYAIYGSFSSIVNTNTQMVIQEIAQPYYFNYYKDSIASNVLFSGNAASVGDYTLSDDITKYKYLLISWQTGNSASGTTAITQTKTDMIPVDTIAIGDTNNKRLWFDMLNDTTLKSVLLLFFKSSKTMTYGFGTASSPWTNPVVTRIEGIGYSYENPYQDVITTVDEFVLSDSAVDTDINSLWSEVGI